METGLIKLLLIWQHRRALTRRDWRRKEVFCFVCSPVVWWARVDFGRSGYQHVVCEEAAPHPSRAADPREMETRKLVYVLFMENFFFSGRSGRSVVWGGDMEPSPFRISVVKWNWKVHYSGTPEASQFPDCLNFERETKKRKSFLGLAQSYSCREINLIFNSHSWVGNGTAQPNTRKASKTLRPEICRITRSSILTMHGNGAIYC